jgi:hypothetical protein
MVEKQDAAESPAATNDDERKGEQAEFEREMELARRVMRKWRNVLRALAKN